MIYLHADKDAFIKYDVVTKTAEVISKTVLTDQIEQLTKTLPELPPDKVLLDWAKENYPGLKQLSEEQNRLNSLKTKLAELLKVDVIIK
jgi:hypothetical protein